jgi:serine/threonine protein kinase
MGISIDGYTADEPLASGGSAEVFRGLAADGREVAMKVIRGSADAALRRARREAGLAAEVNHPHVLEILDIVADGEVVVVVTSFAPGGSLADLLARRGRLSVPESLTVLLPIAAAVATAHERGVVHGDLSPANILFEASGRPVLADLGAARAAGELGEPAVLTPGYVAPEVARGAPITEASDLFSLGAVALHCVTGRPAWNADDLRDVIIQSTVGQWPDPLASDPAVADRAAPDRVDHRLPDPLVSVVRGLLEAEPLRRPGAAAAVLDLRKCGEPEPVDLALQLVRPASAPPPTIARADAPPRPEPVTTRAPCSWSPRRWRRTGPAVDHDRPARHRAMRNRVVPRAVVLLATTVLIAAAVLGGLWWAGRDRPVPTAFGPVSEPSPATSPTSATAWSSPTRSSYSTGPDPARPATTHAAGTTPSARPSSGSAPRQSPGARASSGSSPPSVIAPPAGEPDWTAVVRNLDAQRAAALAHVDPGRLDRVYTADAAARRADARTIGALRAHRWQVAAPTHEIAGVRLVPSSAAGPVIVDVVDRLPAYPVTDATGRVVGTTPARPSGHRLIGLVRTADGYRISSISDS